MHGSWKFIIYWFRIYENKMPKRSKALHFYPAFKNEVSAINSLELHLKSATNISTLFQKTVRDVLFSQKK